MKSAHHQGFATLFERRGLRRQQLPLIDIDGFWCALEARHTTTQLHPDTHGLILLRDVVKQEAGVNPVTIGLNTS